MSVVTQLGYINFIQLKLLSLQQNVTDFVSGSLLVEKLKLCDSVSNQA